MSYYYLSNASILLVHSNYFPEELKTYVFTFCLEPRTCEHSCASVRPVCTCKKLFTSLFSTAIHSTSNVSTKQGNHLEVDSITSILKRVHVSELYMSSRHQVFIFIRLIST